MRTYNATQQTVQHDWYLVDASQKNLGRLASGIAHRLRGKHKAIFTPHVDTGDYIVIVNANKIAVTGNKPTGKIYYRSTSRPGSLKAVPYKDFFAKDPVAVLMHAVKGMLPRGPLGRQMLKKLKAYSGATHPHISQNPKPIDI